MIFYFTGTGNCLYAARELAGEGEEVCSIPVELRHGGALSYADDAIGIVYPIYGHMMPEMVKSFGERAHFDTPYLYFVCTYGSRRALRGGGARRGARPRLHHHAAHGGQLAARL